MIAIRSFLPLLAVLAAVATVGAVLPASAQQRPRPGSPPPAAAATPAAAPNAPPEALDKAIPRLEAKLKADPEDKATATELATYYLQAGRPDLAQPLTQKLLAGGNKSGQVYYLDGAANANLGKMKEAIASLESASNLEPTNMAVLQMLTTVYMRENRTQDAERIAKRALTFNKDNKDAYQNYGFVLAALKRYDEAREQFEVAAKIDPKDPHPVVLEARTYQDQNAMALAAQLFERALSINAKSLEALIGKAQVAALGHNVKDAIATYETILTLQATDFDRAAVVSEIGKVYAAEKMDKEADAAFRRAIDSYPSVPNTHVIYGDYLKSKGDNGGAEREWNAGLGANRDNAEALLRVADLAVQAKDWNKAIELYKRLTEVAQGDPRGWLMLGQSYMAGQKFQDARNAFKQSYGLEHTPEALVGLADADQASRNFAEAIQIYEALDKNAPELVKANPALLFSMGKAYQGANQTQKARDAYGRFLSFLQPGTQNYNEVKQMIDRLGHSPSPAATAHPAPKSSPSPAPKK